MHTQIRLAPLQSHFTTGLSPRQPGPILCEEMTLATGPVQPTGCCQAPRLVPAAPRDANILDGSGARLEELGASVCINCGKSTTDAGLDRTLSADELAAWRFRWAARDAARAAVVAGVPLAAADTQSTFPNAMWLPSMGFCTLLTSGILMPYAGDPRPQLRAIFGSDDAEDPVQVQTAVGPITVDSIYYNHIYEIDPQTGKNRIDADHIAFASLSRRTLERPLEVYLQQPGGKKTQKMVYLALYQVDSAFTYHAVIVTARDKRLLTTYRVNGGRTSFERDRHGVPLYVGY